MSGNIHLHGDTAVIVTGVSTAGSVSIESAFGPIRDAGDATADVTASGLRLLAAGDVGHVVNPLETSVDTIAARTAGGNISIAEQDDIAISVVGVGVRSESVEVSNLGTGDVALDAAGDMTI